MKKTLLKIFLGFVILIALVLVVAAFQATNFTVTRTATIAAPPATVFPHVNDLHKWQVWSPWAKMDPSAKYTFEGPPAGVGATLKWVSANNMVGTGGMTITDSKPDQSVSFRLDFTEPFVGSNTAQFQFKGEGNQTVVSWSMAGQRNYMMKVFGLFMSCDKIIGGLFEQGFANLKATIEGGPRS